MDFVNGSNNNSGSSTGSAIYTSTSGNWDGTSVFTPTDGANPVSAGVAVGQWISIYPNGNTTAPYIAQITAVVNAANGTITAPNANKFGTTPGSTTGTSSAKVGGAWKDFGMLASGVALNTGTVTQSTRVNIKAGSGVGVYANAGTARTFGLSGAGTTPLWWRGYTSSPGDADFQPSATDDGSVIPLITTSAQFTINGSNQVFENLSIRSTTTTASGALTNNIQTYLIGCRVENTQANAASRAVTVNTGIFFAFRCWFKATTTANVVLSVSSSAVVATGCQFVGGSGGVGANAFNFTANFCLFSGSASDGVTTSTGGITLVNCSVYGAGNTSGSGVVMTGAGTLALTNTHIENFTNTGKFAINNSSGTNAIARLVSNSYFGCTAYTNGISETMLWLDVGLLAASGFTNAAGGDFTASTYLKAIGMPGNLENSTLVGYLDNGALQRVEPSGSSGILVYRGFGGLHG